MREGRPWGEVAFTIRLHVPLPLGEWLPPEEGADAPARPCHARFNAAAPTRQRTVALPMAMRRTLLRTLDPSARSGLCLRADSLENGRVGQIRAAEDKPIFARRPIF